MDLNAERMMERTLQEIIDVAEDFVDSIYLDYINAGDAFEKARYKKSKNEQYLKELTGIINRSNKIVKSYNDIVYSMSNRIKNELGLKYDPELYEFGSNDFERLGNNILCIADMIEEDGLLNIAIFSAKNIDCIEYNRLRIEELIGRMFTQMYAIKRSAENSIELASKLIDKSV